MFVLLDYLLLYLKYPTIVLKVPAKENRNDVDVSRCVENKILPNFVLQLWRENFVHFPDRLVLEERNSMMLKYSNCCDKRTSISCSLENINETLCGHRTRSIRCFFLCFQRKKTKGTLREREKEKRRRKKEKNKSQSRKHKRREERCFR